MTNSSQGHSTRYTGGVIGHLNGIIQDCEVNVMVDASKSIGTWNYVGGIAGVARTTLSEKNTTIDNRLCPNFCVNGNNLILLLNYK